MTNTIARLTETLKVVEPEIVQRASYFEDQVLARHRYLRRQAMLKPQVTPAPTNSPGGVPAEVIRPSAWRAQPDNGAQLEGPVTADGRSVFHIVAATNSGASWRSELKLKRGWYRFSGEVQTRGVEALDDNRGKGAGLRLSGASPSRTNQLVGDSPWTTLFHEFEVTSEEAGITLVAELRAGRGEAWFSVNSLVVSPVTR